MFQCNLFFGDSFSHFLTSYNLLTSVALGLFGGLYNCRLNSVWNVIFKGYQLRRISELYSTARAWIWHNFDDVSWRWDQCMRPLCSFSQLFSCNLVLVHVGQCDAAVAVINYVSWINVSCLVTIVWSVSSLRIESVGFWLFCLSVSVFDTEQTWNSIV